MRQNFASAEPYEEIHGYSQVVRHGDNLYVSGLCARDPHVDGCGAHEQTTSALEAMGDALAAAGSGLADVVRTVIYIVDAADAAQVSQAHREAFATVMPASTMVVVSSLLDPRQLVEVQADAVVSSAR